MIAITTLALKPTSKRTMRGMVFTHLEKPCYPSKADLEKLGLKAQGRSWEI